MTGRSSSRGCEAMTVHEFLDERVIEFLHRNSDVQSSLAEFVDGLAASSRYEMVLHPRGWVLDVSVFVFGLSLNGDVRATQRVLREREAVWHRSKVGKRQDVELSTHLMEM